MTTINDERLAPETKAAIIAETLKMASTIEGRTLATALASSVRASLGLAEEVIGNEVELAIFLLVRKGLLDCSTYIPDAAEILFRTDTTVAPSVHLLGYIYIEE